MPSVGMRRSTRVFGVVKGVDGARVLRSGRRVWTGSSESKFRRGNDEDEWLHTLIKNSNSSSLKFKKENGWTHTQSQTHISKLKKEVAKKVNQSVGNEVVKEVNDNGNKMYGIVYSRKRRRMGRGVGMQGNLDDRSDNSKFGIQFSRRQKRRPLKDHERESSDQSAPLSVLVDSNCSSSGLGLAASFLHLVLAYSRRDDFNVPQLAGFLLTETVSCAFSLDGIRFLQGATAVRNGVCTISGVRNTVPIFSLDFTAVPLCFVHMHLRLAFKVRCLSLEPSNKLVDEEDTCDEIMTGSEEHSCGLLKAETTLKTDNCGNKLPLHPSVKASKLGGRHSQYRNALISRGIQKRRRSFRRKRARNPSVIGMPKSSGGLVSDPSSRRNGILFSSVVSKNKLRRSVQFTSTVNLKDASPTVVEVAQPTASSVCCANLLVIDSDRCYRISGASVTLEVSDSKEWVLVVKKDGLTRYTHLAQKIMRPCSFNRMTHDVIWTGDDSWKLEFPDRRDWLIFKDIYKECADRNVPPAIPKAIPVPGVREVLGYEDSSISPFIRPDAYISMNNDEVGRALAKSSANYDMDSEDEEWLKKFNSKIFVEGGHEHLSEENFELTIDAFERALYNSPDDFADEEAAVKLFIHMGRKEVVEAVYGYWMKKRKQRRSVLLRVFQLHRGKKVPLIPKPGLRKRRSFKRQASQVGKGKQPSLLQAMAAEQDAIEEQSAMHNIEAAKAAAKISVESAIRKRREAQMLMENADLAVYKAAMALRIAEAACSPIPNDATETPYLD